MNDISEILKYIDKDTPMPDDDSISVDSIKEYMGIDALEKRMGIDTIPDEEMNLSDFGETFASLERRLMVNISLDKTDGGYLSEYMGYKILANRVVFALTCLDDNFKYLTDANPKGLYGLMPPEECERHFRVLTNNYNDEFLSNIYAACFSPVKNSHALVFPTLDFLFKDKLKAEWKESPETLENFKIKDIKESINTVLEMTYEKLKLPRDLVASPFSITNMSPDIITHNVQEKMENLKVEDLHYYEEEIQTKEAEKEQEFDEPIKSREKEDDIEIVESSDGYAMGMTEITPANEKIIASKVRADGEVIHNGLVEQTTNDPSEVNAKTKLAEGTDVSTKMVERVKAGRGTREDIETVSKAKSIKPPQKTNDDYEMEL